MLLLGAMFVCLRAGARNCKKITVDKTVAFEALLFALMIHGTTLEQLPLAAFTPAQLSRKCIPTTVVLFVVYSGFSSFFVFGDHKYFSLGFISAIPWNYFLIFNRTLRFHSLLLLHLLLYPVQILKPPFNSTSLPRFIYLATGRDFSRKSASCGRIVLIDNRGMNYKITMIMNLIAMCGFCVHRGSVAN